MDVRITIETTFDAITERFGTPADFGGIAVYLASDASRYHSGDNFVIDGGYTAA